MHLVVYRHQGILGGPRGQQQPHILRGQNIRVHSLDDGSHGAGFEHVLEMIAEKLVELSELQSPALVHIIDKHRLFHDPERILHSISVDGVAEECLEKKIVSASGRGSVRNSIAKALRAAHGDVSHEGDRIITMFLPKVHEAKKLPKIQSAIA